METGEPATAAHATEPSGDLVAPKEVNALLLHFVRTAGPELSYQALWVWAPDHGLKRGDYVVFDRAARYWLHKVPCAEHLSSIVCHTGKEHLLLYPTSLAALNMLMLWLGKSWDSSEVPG